MIRYLALAFAVLLAAQNAAAATIVFVVQLDGKQEVDAMGTPGQGDLNGSGTAAFLIDDVNLTITWAIAVNGIDLPLTGAHLHNAAAGANGPIHVDFNGQLVGSVLADSDLASVLANPSQWYVNLHNTAYAPGAIRGQLGTPVPEPAALALLALAAGPFALARRRR